jgi:sterol desaturase/sphingolipid hydroxylase (fatty acid hydroxylase superfamily)
MDLTPVILAIPVFFALMGIELAVEAVTDKKTYRLNDAITNITLGALDQVTAAFTKIVKVGIYTVVWELFAIFAVPQTALSFAALFVLYDLCYYWSHRMAHEISLFWGGHVVHHQSEDFNLSVALRQSSTAFLWSFPFYLPLALIGFSPVQLVFVAGLNLLYQFWIHTEHIGKLGALEWVLNTPSHHRVHHGRDPTYIDRNYAGVFIVWDRIFGTFQEEEERPVYGITKPLNSWNPVYANLAHYMDLFRAVAKARTVGDGLQMLFRRPGWMPDYLGGYRAPRAVPSDYQKYDASVAGAWPRVYVAVQFVAAMAVVAAYLRSIAVLDPAIHVAGAVWIVFTTVMFGLVFERRGAWVVALEVARVAAVPSTLSLLVVPTQALPGWLIGGTALFAILSAAAFVLVFRSPARTVAEARTRP